MVLLTGAGGGIGLETAKAFICMGAKVIIAEFDKQRINNTENILKNQFGNHSAEFYPIDLSDEKQMKGTLRKLEGAF